MHLEAGEMVTAKVSPNGNTYASVTPGNAIHFASPAHAIANGLGIALDLLPELDHVGLVGVRYSLDAMSDRVTALMAEHEFQMESDARADAEDAEWDAQSTAALLLGGIVPKADA
jgi:hypothetical protein